MPEGSRATEALLERGLERKTFASRKARKFQEL